MRLFSFRRLAAVLLRLPVGRTPSFLLAAALALSCAPALAVDLLVSNFTDTPDPATRGGTIVYSATITNNEADTGRNVVLSFILDAQTDYVAVSDARCTYVSGGHGVECRFPTLRGDLSGPGSADEFTVDVTVRSKASAGNTVRATARVASDDTDTNAGNNALEQVTTIDNGADLALALSDAPDPVLAGGTLTYTATVTNQGPNPAGATEVVLTLSPNVSHTSSSGSGWTCTPSGQVVTCRRASAALGVQPAISVVTRVTGAVSGTITTAANVTTSGSATDYAPDNNGASADTQVNPGADLSVTKVVSTARAESDTNVSFTLRPRNAGPFAASNVVVSDTLPQGFGFVSATGTGWICSAAGQTVSCTRASHAVNASNDITVVTRAPTVAVSTGYTNTATVSATTPDPVSANNSGSVSLVVLPPGVDLSITKSKAPNPVAQGGEVRSTIRVTNNGPQAARAGEVSIVETLPTGEDFVRIDSGSNWTCAAPVGRDVTCTYGLALAVSASTSNLVLLTTASGAGEIANTACAVYTDSVANLGDPVSNNNCASASVTVTPLAEAIDLRVAKTVNVDPLVWNANTLVYTVRVTNVADADASDIVMSDTIPGYVSGAAPTGVIASQVAGGTGAVFNCNVSAATVTCTQTGGVLAKDETAEFRIEVRRPLFDSGAGKHTNTASARSTTLGDLNPADNSGSVVVKVDPVTDLRVESSVTPSSTEAGTNATFVLTVTNGGPSTATDVRLREQLVLSAGTLTQISVSNGAGTCTWNGASTTLNCELGSLARNASTTVTLVVRPDFMSGPPAGRTLTGNASVTTGTSEANTANNSAQSVLTITQAALDLLVNLTDSPDPLGYVPAAAGPTYPDNVVTYRAVITNRGPSVASELVLTYRMEAPANKAITFLGDKLAATGQSYANYCDKVGQQAIGGAPLTLTCRFPSNQILPFNNGTTTLYLDFRVDTPPSSSGDTFRARATIASNEPDSVADNNSAEQTTTIRMRSDLQLAKSARALVNGVDAAATVVQLNQPFYWVLTLRNAGPGDSQITTITDVLPNGIALYQPPASAPAQYKADPYAGGVQWRMDNPDVNVGRCSGTGTLTCQVGVLASGRTATVWIPVVAASVGNYRNCASATTSEVDPNSGNNSNICSTVTVQPATLAGAVYIDDDNDGLRGAGEAGIGGVALALNGTDDYGNPVTRAANSNGDGSFNFANLSPGAYVLTETQPTAYLDGRDRAGSAGGTPGAIGTDRIDNITLGAGANASGYLFGELRRASVAGHVFVDTNANAVRDAAERSGISGIEVTLSGSDDLGAVERSTFTGTAGLYTFNDLRPGTYALRQAVIAGVTHTGMSAGSKGGHDGATVLAPGAAAPGADKRMIGGIVIASGDSATGYDFGESGQGLSGFVYIDGNGNGIKDAGEAGIAGVALTLSGRTAGGSDVCVAISPNPCTVRSAANGAYAFSGVPASDAAGYSIAQQSHGDAPLANYADGAEQVGTLGGNAAVNDVFAGIVVRLGDFGNNYNFGERAGALAGRVYLDANGNGVADSGERGIAGVTLSLSGRSAHGVDVCTLIASCIVTSDTDGRFGFTGLPAANADGFSVTQTQPLDYGEGANTPGTAGGVASSGNGTSVISGIRLPSGASPDGYLFGERAGALSGTVYLDANRNGVRDAGETGIAGVRFTLAGNTASGLDVCTLAGCFVTSGADGSYRFTQLPNADAAGYSITQQAQDQAPLAELLDGQVSAGSNCGACVVDNGAPNAVKAVRLQAGVGFTGYDFGELRGSTVIGRVYVDANDNGVQDGREAGISGVTVTLSGRDADGKTVARQLQSGPDGSFRFAGLAQSDAAGYVLTELQPAGWNDGKTTIAANLPGILDGAKPIAVGEHDSVRAIVLGAGQDLEGYTFGERAIGARIAGSVFLDQNNDGRRDAGETGMAGVVIELGGRQLDGVALARRMVTDADGRFSFDGLEPSDAAGYRLVQVQPAGVIDGKTTVGAGLPGVANSAKPVRVGDHDMINAIRAEEGANLDGFDFGEVAVPSLKPPFINGYVWLDRGHARVRPVDGTLQGIAGWTVELRQHAQRICEVRTDAEGFYQFDNLRCAGYEVSGLPTGPGFAIVFSREGSSLPAVAQSGGDKGRPAPTGGMITDITLDAGDQVLEQNLPLDPAGVVYDALTRQPVAGAAVSISGPGGFVAAQHLVGAEAARTQVVGSDGMYQFLLQNDFPSGVYTLSVQAPSGYLAAPSTMLAPCPGAPDVRLVPTPALVQRSDTAPAASTPRHDPANCAGIVAGGAESTQYYFAFHITNGGSAPILNNHIPLDRVSGTGLVLTKTTPMVNVARGELVPYTIGASNGTDTPLPGVVLRDSMPPGFKYRPGSARVNGVASEPLVSGRDLAWPALTLAPRSRVNLTLVLAVGSGVGEGEYVNQALALDVSGSALSNLATASVRIVPDATFDCPDVIGKVFDDANANGYQDEGEAGLPAVRLATPRGLLITTDAQGRYHVPCAELPNPDRGSNFVLKLDDRTLPSGYRVTTGNPGDVRVTRGKVSKLNFGATIHRVVRVELLDAAYEAGTDRLDAQWNQQIDIMMQQLKNKPSVLRIAYGQGADGAQAAKRRVQALREDIGARWRALGDIYPLAIEVEDVR